ncbi:hypothetical protein IJD34_08755 [bacterium]|nr:hypothetical protein [bacterium]
MAPSIEQVKIFSNGIKSVLTRQTKNKPAVLRLFNPEGKMISYREIQRTRRKYDYSIKKLTANATQKEKSLEFSSKILDSEGDVLIRKMKMSAGQPVNETYINIEEGVRDVRHQMSYWDDWYGMKNTINNEMKVLNQNNDMGFWAQNNYTQKAQEINDRWTWMTNWQNI